LAAENKWDLADLVANALEVLQVESDLAAAFRSVRYLMVDEFQDTALPEYQFLQAILGENRNLFCVGAVAQSIYAWRGAEARELLERFESRLPGGEQDHPAPELPLGGQNHPGRSQHDAGRAGGLPVL
jgi:DNA helicase II / ATP-dependent DNA helicase PcrA